MDAHGVLRRGACICAVCCMVLQAVGPVFYKMVVVAAILAYMCLFTMLWFVVTEKIIARTGAARNFTVRLWVWTCTSWFYFFVIHTYCLAPFNRCEGYIMVSPLIPLVVRPYFLQLLPVVGEHVLLFLLCCVYAAGAFLMHRKTKKAVVVLMIIVLPWVLCAVLKPARSALPAWLSKVSSVPMMVSCAQGDFLVQCVGHRMHAQLCKNSQIELLIFPESAVNTALDGDTFFSDLYAHYLPQSVHCMGGTFMWREGGQQYHNIFLWAHAGGVRQQYAKRHAMMLIEALPTWCNFSAIAQLYCTCERPAITPSKNKRPLLQVPFLDGTILTCTPYICSELFFNEFPDDGYVDVVIIALVNDLWAPIAFTRRCMVQTAAYKAIAWQRPILYVSYHYCAYIDAQGNILFM
jgi:hypothetical protein